MGKASRNRKRKRLNSNPDDCIWPDVVDFFHQNQASILLLFLSVVFATLICGSMCGISGLIGWKDDVLESLLQTTPNTKGYDVKFVDDRKIQKLSQRIDALHELSATNDDRYWNKLLDLDDRVRTVERSLTVTTSNCITREELSKFLEEFQSPVDKRKEELELGFKEEMVGVLRGIIRNEIDKHAADGLGRVDHAAAGGGGVVVGFSEPYHRADDDIVPDHRVVHGISQIVLKPSFGEPGQCFPLNGSSGNVVIRLKKAIVPDAITLEHVAKSVVYDRTEAPKDCRVYGWLRKDEKEFLHVDPEDKVFLAEFSYDLDKCNVQTFDVWKRADPYEYAVDTIRFEFTSNHGDPNRTCIYRVRVHGHEPGSQPTW